MGRHNKIASYSSSLNSTGTHTRDLKPEQKKKVFSYSEQNNEAEHSLNLSYNRIMRLWRGAMQGTGCERPGWLG
jgi:Leucine-rich repeat (LRR) protein